jgi:hypothetical protein
MPSSRQARPVGVCRCRSSAARRGSPRTPARRARCSPSPCPDGCGAHSRCWPGRREAGDRRRRGVLLGVAVHLADGAFDVDHAAARRRARLGHRQVVRPAPPRAWWCSDRPPQEGTGQVTLHRNAKTCPAIRLLLCSRVIDQDGSLRAGAEAAGLSERRARSVGRALARGGSGGA